MTDRERFFAFCEGAGITPRLTEMWSVPAYEIGEDDGDVVSGYVGFVTCYAFDDDGKLIQMGAYE